MARRPAPPRDAPKRSLTPDELRNGVARLEKRIEELTAFDPTKMTATNPPELSALSTSIERTLGIIFGEYTADYHRFRLAANLQWHPNVMMMPGGRRPPLSDYIHGVMNNRERSSALLREAVRTLTEDLAEQEQQVQHPQQSQRSGSEISTRRKVFVVHGHDEAAREAMARFLEKIELEAIILHEQPDKGLTIIEKFEEYASQVSFTVVLLTPDDLGGAASAPAQLARARQNVIFELGYFVGKLGRGRACLLRKGEVEIPSDLYGVIYTDMDAAEGWKLKLVKELKAAGLDFDANKVWS
jgi:predicted nucleotide-binding protein